ncbi:MAG: FoF1 ATP synthase subunit gamma, partial [bacterium]
YQPTAAPFLPISADALGAEEVVGGSGVILEPDAESIFDSLIPRYLETRVYNTLVESLTSEYASRRFAMKNATDAANDMQKVLKGVYNRKRQEGITTDLLDIVGGAEALR